MYWLRAYNCIYYNYYHVFYSPCTPPLHHTHTTAIYCNHIMSMCHMYYCIVHFHVPVFLYTIVMIWTLLEWFLFYTITWIFPQCGVFSVILSTFHTYYSVNCVTCKSLPIDRNWLHILVHILVLCYVFHGSLQSWIIANIEFFTGNITVLCTHEFSPRFPLEHHNLLTFPPPQID